MKLKTVWVVAVVFITSLSYSASSFADLDLLFKEFGETREREMKAEAEEHAKEIDCLVRAVTLEAAGEPELGQRWVLHVIQNRKDLGYRGAETYCDVVLDPYQFSAFNGNPDRRPDPNRRDLRRIQKMVEEWYWSEPVDITGCSTHYLRSDIKFRTFWSRQALEHRSPEGLELRATIGEHTFFGSNLCSEDTENH